MNKLYKFLMAQNIKIESWQSFELVIMLRFLFLEFIDAHMLFCVCVCVSLLQVGFGSYLLSNE